ncbi:HSP70/90 co-chaperone, partial [Candidozyma auris]
MKIEEVSAEDKIISEWERRRYRPKPGEPELPPQLSGFANKSTDEVLKEINRLPFFMTELDETDGEGGQNESLEALKSLAYDGEPHEIAANFKNQGNECYKVKRYKDAVQFYTQGIEIECKDDQINTALLINRAA